MVRGDARKGEADRAVRLTRDKLRAQHCAAADKDGTSHPKFGVAVGSNSLTTEWPVSFQAAWLHDERLFTIDR
jgi:hypothetical protein